ncbi:hypothetical protein GCM10011512_02600 [Tersicoccus solisilvae]|uniref:Uncharacterized protein n=1 Tax=Tersicoccus solisilvae TaxID=1882339 RepID=A0ABQ1NLG1_9MICC|nr:hypothetical protein GCM10011512_02600 [Tersicoccus solisilvae]
MRSPPRLLGQADPVSLTWTGTDRFAAVLFYSRDGTSSMGTGGIMPDGGATKILWLVPDVDASSGPLTVRGVSAGGNRFQASFDGGGSYSSIVKVPAPGCWTLTGILQGRVLGNIVIPVVPS